MAEISLKRLGTALDRPHARVEAYAVFLAGSSLAVAIGLLGAGYTLGNPWAVAALCIAAALAQRGQIEVTGAHKVSISLFPILLAAVFAAQSALWPSRCRQCSRGDAPLPGVLYASSRSLTGVAG